jgi:Fe-S oxidoreductase
MFYGEKIYEVFREIKSLFDPDHLLNPHRIIDPPLMDINLRKGTMTLPEDFEQQFIYREQIDFEHALLQCTGISACRKTRNGTMCPSYMATLDEEHSTRGRANALRMAIEGNIDLSNDKRLEEVFDLCLSCKACKSECPSNVDMARLKAELIHYRHQRGKPGLVEKMFRDSVNMAKRLSGPQAKLINPVQGSKLFKWGQSAFLGIDPRRTLPAYTVMPFSRWYRRNTGHNRTTTDVLLFADSYLNYYEPHIGRAIVNTLEKFNIRPQLFTGFCCQRPRISTGFLEKAKLEGRRLMDALIPHLQEGKKLIVCEPSCHSALTDDMPDLIEGNDHVDLMKERIVTLEAYIASILEEYGNPGLVPANTKFVYHGHCHQKALEGTDAIHRIFRAFSGLEITEPDSGCCGMAGAFGYEAGHYEVSERIGERVLFPTVRSAPDAEILASGFSCRHQIRDFTGRKAKHWIEIFAPDAE